MRVPMKIRGLFFRFLAALACAALTAPALQAQEPPRKVAFSYRVEPNPVDTDRSLRVLYLRPNTALKVAFSLHNDDANVLGKGVVKLVRLEGKRVEVLATANVAKVAKKDRAPLTFVKVEAAPKEKEPPPKDKAAPPKEKEEEFKITGPKHALQLWLEEAGRDTAKHDFNVWFGHPSRYITAEASYDRAAKRMNFAFEMDPKINGNPLCEVELSFFPELPRLPDSVLKRQLRETGKKLQMPVDNLEFDETSVLNRTQRVFVKADGFDRAFEFVPSFTGGGKIESVSYLGDVAVRYRVPRYTLPTEKLETTLEIDGPLEEFARIEYGWNPTGTKDPDQFQPRSNLGLRDMRLKFDVVDGDVVIATKVRDWKVEFNTEGAQGQGLMRVAVLTGLAGDVREPVSKDALVPFRTFLGTWSPLTIDNNNVYAAVTLDKTAPEGVAFDGLPKEWPADKPLVLLARVIPRDEKRQAPIDRVIFYLSKPLEKLAPEIVQKEAVLDKNGRYTAELPLAGKLGPVDVTVQVETRTGKKTAVAAVVNVRDFSKDPKLTTIRGAVVKGSNPAANVDVFLMDTKLWQMNDAKAQKGLVKTDAKGQFEFTDVAPGSYSVAASEGDRQANVPVQVPAGKTLIDNLKLSLLLK